MVHFHHDTAKKEQLLSAKSCSSWRPLTLNPGSPCLMGKSPLCRYLLLRKKMCIVGFTCQTADSNLLLLQFSDHKGNRSVRPKHAADAFCILEIPTVSPAHLVWNNHTLNLGLSMRFLSVKPNQKAFL